MKSCENCKNNGLYCINGDDMCKTEDKPYFEPDYETLEQENVELNQALERACEWQAKSIVDDGYRCCESCPFQLNKKICLKYSGGCNLESLKSALLKHFKEGQNNG